MRPCAFVLPFPLFSSVSTVILCRSGNPPRKPTLKNQNEIFPKPSPGGLLAAAPLRYGAVPLPFEIESADTILPAAEPGKEKGRRESNISQEAATSLTVAAM